MQRYPDSLFDATPIVAADTVVSLDNEVLGKPRDAAEAIRFLERLSGKTHEVRTAVWVGIGDAAFCDVNLSLVRFRTLRADEIAGYVATGEPFDKAGGYGIQGYGALLVEGIRGDYFNVVGLPICRLGRMLAQVGGDALAQCAQKCAEKER